MVKGKWTVVGIAAALVAAAVPATSRVSTAEPSSTSDIFGDPQINARMMVADGKNIFRNDTFGDETFWTGKLHLEQAIVTLSPSAALGLGLKVDSRALTPSQLNALEHGKIDLNDPKVTVQLIKQAAVLGVVGLFGSDGSLQQVGITCALCHSTVDNSIASGVGRRIDGVANRDLNVGAIIAAAPNLQPLADLLGIVNHGITVAQVRQVLLSWGPGKFDAEIFLDGKAFQPNGRSAATLIPNARGLAGFNLHTWTGGWGSLPYWNAFVAVDEMHGIGTFFDARFDDATQFPIAAAAGLGHISVDPDSDKVTSKLPALQFYQLALSALKPRPGVDFDVEAAERGDELFSGKADCNRCHHEPLWSEPGWNTHPAADIKIDSFEADRSPDHSYKTMNLAGIFQRERGLFMKAENKGRFYHDGRFATLLDVVQSYNVRFNLHLTASEQHDVVEYLKSL